MRLAKYQGLGNDYIVLEPGELNGSLTEDLIRQICDRHYGLGSDGILFGPLEASQVAQAASAAPSATDAAPNFALRIFNPDGTEAEKSGNGLRIFCRYLWDHGLLQMGESTAEGTFSQPFIVLTLGGKVRAQVLAGGQSVIVEMGQASFDSQRIPVAGPRREVLEEKMRVAGREVCYCAVSMGNPHCVVLAKQVEAELAFELGRWIENEPRFPNRTNVQFMQILDRHNIKIEIWERGVGYTLASGSSSCAAAATAYRLGLCASPVTVHMPGGELQIEVSKDLFLTMTGPVGKAYEGDFQF